MGRTSIRLAIDGALLKSLVGDRVTWSEKAEKYGVTRQAVSAWLSEGLIPPRPLAELVHDLDLTAEQVEAVLAPQSKKNKERKRWKVTVLIDEPESDNE